MKSPNNPQDYLSKKLPIIPCREGEKIPKYKTWQNMDFTEEDFSPTDNIGLKWDGYFDIDIDNPIVRPFLNNFLEPCAAIYGRKSNPKSHFIFKGKPKFKKFSLPSEFDKYTKNFEHGSTLIEIRSGSDKQSIVPGSKVKGELVKWDVFEGISPYGGNAFEDVSKIALGGALSLMFPNHGARQDYCFTIACILTRIKGWTEDKINEFVSILAKANGYDDEIKRINSFGTLAYKQIEKKGRMKGFVSLKEITGVEYGGLISIFSWVGLEEKNKKILELIPKYFYIEDCGQMFDPKTELTIKDKDFNNKWLYDFPGGRNKDKAFSSLLKHPEFQEKKVISRQFLPKESYPIAELKDHPLLPPGKYLNIFKGFPIEGRKPDANAKQKIKEFENHYNRILGEDNWNMLRQYIAFCVRNPGVKCRWSFLIVGPEGTGKGALMRTISNMLGHSYVNENVSFNDITEKHSTIVVGSLFVCLNEVSIDGGQYSTKRTVSAKIKPFITDDFMNINEKGKPIYKYLNCCNSIIYSNDIDCLHVDTSSRRYCVIHIKTTTKEIERIADEGVFKDLFKIIDDFKEELLYHFKNNIEIEDEDIYQKRAPKTEDLKEMQEDSRHDLVSELDQALDEHLAPFDDEFFRGFISLNQLIYFIRTQWKISNPNRKIVKRWLKENGKPWKDGSLTRQIVMEASKPRVYLLGDNSEELKECSEGELGRMADVGWPGEYVEAQILDYKMGEDKYRPRTHPSTRFENTSQKSSISFQRNIYKFLSMPIDTLEEILNIKKELNSRTSQFEERKKLIEAALSKLFKKGLPKI